MNEEKKFMDHGLLVWEKPDNTFKVQKVKTDKSPTDILCNEPPNCGTKDFDTIGSAYSFCRKFIEEGNLKECTVQIAYNPTGHSLKVVCLNNIEASSFEEAEEIGKKNALEYFKKEGLIDRIGNNYELKIKPKCV